MTRETQIINFAKDNCRKIAQETDYTRCAAFEGIITGAEWADKTMLDNVCRWLDMNLNDYITEGNREGMSKEKREEMFKDLRKDMKV